MERDEEHFDLDEEFVAGAEEEDFDRFIDRVDRRKQAAAVKRGKAAWSKLEDVLAEKRLQKALKDSYDDVFRTRHAPPAPGPGRRSGTAR